MDSDIFTWANEQLEKELLDVTAPLYKKELAATKVKQHVTLLLETWLRKPVFFIRNKKTGQLWNKKTGWDLTASLYSLMQVEYVDMPEDGEWEELKLSE